MTQLSDIAMVLAVESNAGIRTGMGEKYRYEDELVMCVTMWRKKGGVYKDIPIYAICPSANVLPQEVIEQLNELNVKYIQLYMNAVECHPCAWYNKPLVCSWFEKTHPYSRIFHLDLDCYLIKEPTDEFFRINDGSEAKVAYYTCGEQDDFESGLTVEYNTGCIVAHNGFYTKWYDALMDAFGAGGQSHRYYCELEEAILSMGGFNIHQWHDPTIEDIILGTKFNINQYLKDDDRYYFIHEHISTGNIVNVSRVISSLYV